MVNIAQYGMLVILFTSLVFHICIILRLIPYDKVWGGRLKSDNEMIRFESVSILITLILLGVLLVNATLIDLQVPPKLMSGLFWFMAGLFFLNTVGNFLSKNKFERLVFTPITILLTVFSLILALG